MDRRRYIQTVTDQIRCKRALPLVTKELEDHIEDQKCDYMTEGMEPSEAEEAAVLEMGDPVEVGIEMDRIHRPKMAWKMIGLIAVLNLAGILLMYCLRTSALADVGNNPGEVEGITSGIGGNIDYLKNIAWTFAGLACMIGICYVDYSWIGKYAKRLAGIWIVVMGLVLFGMALPLRPLLYLIVPLYAAILYSMRSKKTGCVGIAKAILWQVLPIWFILRIPNLSMAVSIEFTFLILLSIAVWKDWFEVNRKRTLITMWSLVILLPAAGMTLMIKMGYVRAYQSARLSAVLVIAVIGAVLIWFLQKTGHQKNQLGMIMGTGCVVVLFTQFIGYVVENLGYFPLSNNYCPFLTAGGSGIMISYIMFGILLSIYRYQNVLVETEVKKKIGI